MVHLRVPRKAVPYHSAAPDDKHNFRQKVVLDLRNIPRGKELWGDHVTLCAPETASNKNGTLMLPRNANSYPYPDERDIVTLHWQRGPILGETIYGDTGDASIDEQQNVPQNNNTA